MADKQYKPGDKVAWESSGGHSEGKVVKKITDTARVKGHVAKASPDSPEYLVRSDKSGGEAIHKPGALKKPR